MTLKEFLLQCRYADLIDLYYLNSTVPFFDDLCTSPAQVFYRLSNRSDYESILASEIASFEVIPQWDESGKVFQGACLVIDIFNNCT